MDLLRLWLLATLAFVAGWLIWVFVPVLVPMIAVALGLGLLVVLIVKAARALEHRVQSSRGK